MADLSTPINDSEFEKEDTVTVTQESEQKEGTPQNTKHFVSTDENGNLVSDRAVTDFGWEELYNIVTAAINTMEGYASVSDESRISRVQNGLTAVFRKNISAGQYLNSNHAIRDMELLSHLVLGEDALSDSTTKVDKSISQALFTNNDFYGTKLDLMKKAVHEVYTVVFSSGFELDPFVGVIIPPCKHNNQRVFSSSYAELGKGSVSPYMDDKKVTMLNSIASKLMGMCDTTVMTVSGNRQFDYEYMIDNHKTTYTPLKILEYAMGRTPTLNIDSPSYPYKFTGEVLDWGAYWTKYVEPNIETVIRRAMVYSFKKHAGIGTEITEAQLKEATHDPDIADAVGDDMTVVQDSMSTIFLLRTYDQTGGYVTQVSVRAVNTPGVECRLDETKAVFKTLLSNVNAPIDNSEFLTSGVESYRVIEYRIDLNQEVTDRTPLWGYQAVQKFTEIGKPLNWSNILLGKKSDKSSVFSGDIGMKECIVHNISAATRGGKGVMTMNMLAAAIASGKPIFYLDRKPDVAGMLMSLTGGNMFIVNGGQYQAKYDDSKALSEEGAIYSNWRTAYANMPEEMQSWFNGNTLYNTDGSVADLMYLRAMVLMLGIALGRVEVSSGGAVSYDDLGGKDGLIFIFDEMTNMLRSLDKIFGRDGVAFGKDNALLKSGSYDSYTTYMEQIQEKTAVLMEKEEDKQGLSTEMKTIDAQIANIQATTDEKGKPRKTPELDSKKKAKQNEIKEIDKEIKAIQSGIDTLKTKKADLEKASVRKQCCSQIWWDFFEKSMDALSAKKNAGFAGDESALLDFILIGQDLEKRPMTTMPFNTSANRLNKAEVSVGSTPILGLIYSLCSEANSDWFIGRNDNGYLGAKQGGDPVANKLLSFEKQYFAYVRRGDYASVTSTDKPPSSVFFKPYLVLKTNDEDDPDATTREDKYDSVDGCRSRVNGGTPENRIPHGLWDDYRFSILSSEGEEIDKQIRAENRDLSPAELKPIRYAATLGKLHEGIGFAGLVTIMQENMQLTQGVTINGVGHLSKSKQIADRVAQVLGYANYWEYLFDFTYEGMYNVDDIAYALKNGAPLPPLERLGDGYKLLKAIEEAELADIEKASEEAIKQPEVQMPTPIGFGANPIPDTQGGAESTDDWEPDGFDTGSGAGAPIPPFGQQNGGEAQKKQYKAPWGDDSDEDYKQRYYGSGQSTEQQSTELPKLTIYEVKKIIHDMFMEQPELADRYNQAELVNTVIPILQAQNIVER